MSARLAELVQKALGDIADALEHLEQATGGKPIGYVSACVDNIRATTGEIGSIEWREDEN